VIGAYVFDDEFLVGGHGGDRGGNRTREWALSKKTMGRFRYKVERPDEKDYPCVYH
jgi:hypothetical protein